MADDGNSREPEPDPEPEPEPGPGPGPEAAVPRKQQRITLALCQEALFPAAYLDEAEQEEVATKLFQVRSSRRDAYRCLPMMSAAGNPCLSSLSGWVVTGAGLVTRQATRLRLNDLGIVEIENLEMFTSLQYHLRVISSVSRPES
jgi:hypothetical protein